MNAAERIVVTGMGVVSPVATGVDAFHHALAASENGISVVEFPWETGYKVLRAGCVKNFDLAQFFPDPPEMGRASQLAVAASMLALRDAGLDFPPPHSDRLGLVVGTAMGDVDEFEAAWQGLHQDRKSTRLNSSHGYISYAVFCLKKKKEKY